MNPAYWQAFLTRCTHIQDPVLLNHFFNLLLTFEERETIAARFLIIQALLEKKHTQREISEKYHVSIAQITRGSNALQTIHADLKAFLNKVL